LLRQTTSPTMPGKLAQKKVSMQVAVPKRKTASAVVQKIRGRGDYSIGSKIGGKIGSWVGDTAQKFIEGITGMGDYSVKMNSIVSPSGPPVFAQNGRHDIIVCHREFVSLVSSVGVAFNVNSYSINPTSNSFVWLPALASNFELFKFLGIVYEFKATSATAVSSTNTALGSVILATRYNALTPQFASQMQMEAYEFSTSTVAFTSCIHPVECAPSENALSELYTDPGFASGDPRFSILGILDVATVGQQASSVVGELWVSYHIQLIRPRLLGLISTQGFTSRYGLTGQTISSSDIFAGIRAAQVSNLSALSPGGADGNLQLNGLPNSMSLELAFGGGNASTPANTIIFPIGVSGAFTIQVATTSSTSVTLAIPSLSSSNGLNLVGLQLNGSAFSSYPSTGSVTVFAWMFSIGVFIVPNPSGGNPTLTFGTAGVFPQANPATIVVQCFQINS